MAADGDKMLKCFISVFSGVLVQIGFQAQWEILGSIGEGKYCLLDLGKWKTIWSLFVQQIFVLE